MPDGTNLGGATSNLVSTFNAKFGSAATWQNQILKAAQTWAQQTNLNFAVVSDNGAAAGSGSYQQGDPGFGDIRIGGYNFGTSTLAQAYLPPPINNYSIAGDFQFNTGTTYNIGSTYDLFTVALHEIGHSLGLLHVTTTTPTMYSTYNGVDSALNSDDISGIKYIYSAGAARTADSYDAAKSNGTTSAATVVTSLINTTTKTAVINNLDLTTSSDLDYFKFVVPSGSATTLKAKVVTQGLSLMNPKVEILDSAGAVKATATAASTAYGTTITASFTGIAAGQTYYVKVSSADSIAAFKTGKYSLVLNMGTGTDPAVTYSSTQLANGSPLSSGGGMAIQLNAEALVNSATASSQQTSDRAVATSTLGDYVVTWASAGQDGNGWGVYAQRYDSNGVKQGGEFRVNTTTLGDQVEPTVAMDFSGNFVIVWSSLGQDGSGSGVYAQRYRSDGVADGGEFRVNTTTVDGQSAPSVVMDTWGRFVIAWSSLGQDGSGAGVYAQRYDSVGNPQGGEFRVNSATAGDQTDAALAMNRLTGDFVVTWSSAGQDGGGAGIYAQRYAADGTAQGTEFRVNTTTALDQTDPSLAIHRLTGDFVVTWTSAGQDGNGTGIYAQRYNASGLAQGSEFRVNTTTTGDQTDSSVAMDLGGNLLVTWSTQSTQANGWQVFGQQFSSGGLKNEAEFVVNGTLAGDQNSASVAMDFFGKTIVVWSGNGVGDTSGVYSQRYRADLILEVPDEAADGHTGHVWVDAVWSRGSRDFTPRNAQLPMTAIAAEVVAGNAWDETAAGSARDRALPRLPRPEPWHRAADRVFDDEGFLTLFPMDSLHDSESCLLV
jgi:hypothetical protein